VQRKKLVFARTHGGQSITDNPGFIPSNPGFISNQKRSRGAAVKLGQMANAEALG